VVVDRASGHRAVPSLVANPPIAVDALCAALAGWGHRRIAWIGDARSDPVIATRRERWLAGGGGLELPCDRAAIAAAVRARACDALLAAAMPHALLALRGARDAGARVPEDVAVAVVNDEGLGDTLVPALCAPCSPDLVHWLSGALGWLAGEPWQPPAPSSPISIERRETA
jgi:DNA-binding LacI/PurR family transcriptional regulator